MSCKEKGLRCYARRYPDGVWGAKCVDLEIATEGRSLAHAQEMLDEAIALYLEVAMKDSTPEEAAIMLSRKSALWERAAWEVLYHVSTAGHHIGKMTAFIADWPTLQGGRPATSPC